MKGSHKKLTYKIEVTDSHSKNADYWYLLYSTNKKEIIIKTQLEEYQENNLVCLTETTKIQTKKLVNQTHVVTFSK